MGAAVKKPKYAPPEPEPDVGQGSALRIEGSQRNDFSICSAIDLFIPTQIPLYFQTIRIQFCGNR